MAGYSERQINLEADDYSSEDQLDVLNVDNNSWDLTDEEIDKMAGRAEARLAERLRVLDEDEAAGRRRLNELEGSL